MARSKSTIFSGADALDWDEAMRLVGRLENDGRWKDALLVSCGCFLGLRISDLLTLTWHDICSSTYIVVKEKKTGKMRRLKINPTLQATARRCMQALGAQDESLPALSSQARGGRYPMTRQRAAQRLKAVAAEYGIASAEHFSTHSLRKTFGRRVWTQECDRGRGDQALLLLCDIFGHSSVNITKRYLGIRQEEILSVYDSLD